MPEQALSSSLEFYTLVHHYYEGKLLWKNVTAPTHDADAKTFRFH